MRDASYKGVRFDWTEMGRSVQNESQIHRFPNKVDASGKVTAIRKPQVDQTSTGPRQFSGIAVFTGDDADVRASAFWDAVEAPGAGTFVHPIYGEMQAVAEAGDERRVGGDSRYVAIDVKFTEDGRADLVVEEVSAVTVATKAAAARLTLTERATLVMAPCLTDVSKAAAATAAVGDMLSDVEGAMQTVMAPTAVQPVLAAMRGLQGDAASLVLVPADLASDWTACLGALVPMNLFAAAAAARQAQVDRTEAVIVGVQDLVRDTAAVAAAEAAVLSPGTSSKAALALARVASDELRACALLASTPEIYAAMTDLAGATVKALQDASGLLPQTRVVPIAAPASPLVLAGDLYPDDPEAGALELLTTPGATGLFIPAGSVEVAGG